MITRIDGFIRNSTNPLVFKTTRITTFSKNILFFEALAYSLSTDPTCPVVRTVNSNKIDSFNNDINKETALQVTISYFSLGDESRKLFEVVVCPTNPCAGYLQSVRGLLDLQHPQQLRELSYHEAVQLRSHSTATLLKKIPN